MSMFPRDHPLPHRSGRPQVMGIVNVTPDSFSDGGCFRAHRALAQGGRRLGADILDIGGESDPPRPPPSRLDEELRRVLPVLTAAV